MMDVQIGDVYEDLDAARWRPEMRRVVRVVGLRGLDAFGRCVKSARVADVDTGRESTIAIHTMRPSRWRLVRRGS